MLVGPGFAPPFERTTPAYRKKSADTGFVSSSSVGARRYFLPLTAAGDLTLLDLRTIDDAYGRVAKTRGRPETSRPQNVTLAFFYDDVDSARPGACAFRSSRAPGGRPPTLEAVAAA